MIWNFKIGYHQSSVLINGSKKVQQVIGPVIILRLRQLILVARVTLNHTVVSIVLQLIIQFINYERIAFLHIDYYL